MIQRQIFRQLRINLCQASNTFIKQKRILNKLNCIKKLLNIHTYLTLCMKLNITTIWGTQYYAKATGVRSFPHTPKPLAMIINSLRDSDR